MLQYAERSTAAPRTYTEKLRFSQVFAPAGRIKTGSAAGASQNGFFALKITRYAGIYGSFAARSINDTFATEKREKAVFLRLFFPWNFCEKNMCGVVYRCAAGKKILPRPCAAGRAAARISPASCCALLFCVLYVCGIVCFRVFLYSLCMRFVCSPARAYTTVSVYISRVRGAGNY